MDACIISTAQQASPKVIHISEPVRAHWIRSSAEVTRKPRSGNSLETSVKNGSFFLAPPARRRRQEERSVLYRCLERVGRSRLSRHLGGRSDPMGAHRLADVDDLRAGLLRRGDDAGVHAPL